MDNKDKLQYTFRTDRNAEAFFSERYLVCPKCGEQLRQMDIENFSRCPFCNHPFELNEELEDFLLEPTVEMWIRQQGAAPSGTGPLN